jgi:hypothetical protein
MTQSHRSVPIIRTATEAAVRRANGDWTGSAFLAGALVLATAAAMPATANATDPQWPASPEFPSGALVPSQFLGEIHLGWTHEGGGWIAEATADRPELWQTIYVRDGAATVAIVTPETTTADGSVESWRVLSTLLLEPNADIPLAWVECQPVSGAQQPVYARWAPGLEPSDVWTFEPEAERFRHISPEDVSCAELGD